MIIPIIKINTDACTSWEAIAQIAVVEAPFDLGANMKSNPIEVDLD